jgi:hypothetical protein
MNPINSLIFLAASGRKIAKKAGKGKRGRLGLIELL